MSFLPSIALSLMKAQAAVAEHPEFKGNVAFVGTCAFWRPVDASPSAMATTGTRTPRPAGSSARRTNSPSCQETTPASLKSGASCSNERQLPPRFSAPSPSLPPIRPTTPKSGPRRCACSWRAMSFCMWIEPDLRNRRRAKPAWRGERPPLVGGFRRPAENFVPLTFFRHRKASV